MKNALPALLRSLPALVLSGLTLHPPALHSQTLLNVDFGVGHHSPKTGFAATGQSTNDFWNLYRHYDPKFVPGTRLVHDGELKNLKLADGADTKVSLTVSNAPGVWGNASGDAMYDTYIFASNGSNLTVVLRGLEAGRYHFYFYGHADPDTTGEQNSIFTIRSGTNHFGPFTTVGSNGWKATAPWQERYQFTVARDVPVLDGTPVFLEVAPGPNGIAVLNGLQIISRGTSPPRLVSVSPAVPSAASTNLLIHQVRYDGSVSDNAARFQVGVEVESMTTNEVSSLLFEGDLALLAPELPPGLRLVSHARQYRLYCTSPGRHSLRLELIARITKAEPWNQISFTGPAAAIASITAAAASPGVEMQLLGGTQLEAATKTASRVQGFLGAERMVSLRWQGKTAEVARKSLVTVETLAAAQITPTVIKFSTRLRYVILQAPAPKLSVRLPATQTLTKVQGQQIRDWSVQRDGEGQLLTIEFVKPVDRSYDLTLLTEQPVDTTPFAVSLTPPQPINLERESGSFNLSADDMTVEIDSATGLHQVNAPAGTLAAYRFFGRPFALAARLTRIEPILNVADRVTVRLEETRLLVSHALTLNVEKSGVYTVEFTPQAGFVVTDVRGEGLDDWKMAGGKLRVNFSARLLGLRRLDVQLEQPNRAFPDQVTVTPLRATGATNETTQIGAAAALGIRLKTAGDLTGLREVPVTALPQRSDELLAYTADAGDWQLMLAAERLPARVVADLFNLVTIGDGLVGGSVVLRYGILNQGAQNFRLKLPVHWKNVEFTGPNIRHKESHAAPAGSPDTNFVTWNVVLQDKAWGGYTLVVTYDYSFDPQKAALDLAGAHAVNVERETGSIALTIATSLQLQARPVTEPLRLIDQSELSEADRALITRPVLLAYRYTGDHFSLGADVVRSAAVPDLLNAVADRIQITSVLTEEGQMLSQASFMVKNNDKQFQKFRLPSAASLWGCYVNNQPVKAEQDGEWLLVSLPRAANRDAAFAVDIVYKQTLPALQSRVIPKSLELIAPRTDVPNTYAEWQLYVPTSQRLSGFTGSMSVQRGTTYGWREAWSRFGEYYAGLFREYRGAILFFGGGGLLLVALVGAAIHKGRIGVVAVLVLFCIVVVLAGMLLPALAKAKAKSQLMRSAEFAEALQRDAELARQPASVALNGEQQVANDPLAFITTPALAGSDSPGATTAGLAPSAPPGAAGLRSIRIEIPRQGQMFTFTKVLNVGEEPLSVRLSVMGLKPFQIIRSGCQLAFFLAGLLLAWREWVRWPRRSLRLSLSLACVIGSVGALGLSLRVLHLWLIAAVPILAGLLVIWGLRRFWPRRPSTTAPEPGPAMPLPETGPAPGTPPAVAGIALLASLSLAIGAAQAQDADPSAQSRLPANLNNAVSLISAVYTGVVHDKVAQFDVTLTLSSIATNQSVFLFSPEVAVEQFSADAKEARLVRQDGGVALQLGEKGNAVVKMKLVAKLEGDVTQRKLVFAIPPALASQFEVSIEEAGADVEFPSAVSFQRVTNQTQTRVEAILGAGNRVELLWTPRMKRLTEMAASIFAQNTTLVTLGSGAVNTRSVVDYQITQGELRQAKVQLPTGQRLLRVEGESIRTWELNDEPGGPVLTVDLLKGISSGYRLTIETERVLEQLPAESKVEIPHVQDVMREHGLVAVRGSEELSLSIGNAGDLQRVDLGEWTQGGAFQADGVISAFRFLKPDFRLTVRAEAVQPQIEAVTRQSFRVGFEQLSLAAQVDYQVKRAGVFTLRLAVPNGYKVESVSGKGLARWTEKAGPRVVEVTLQERTLGAYQLVLSLAQSHKELPKTLALAGVTPLEVEKLNGWVSVSSEPGVAFKAANFDGLMEIPAAALGDGKPGGSSVLAYKFLSTDPATAATWKLSLGVEAVESWVRAEVVNVVSLSDTLITGRSLLRYEIQNAPIKEFRLKVPAACTNVEIFGANIRRRDQTNDQWRVELQNKVRGVYLLTVTWDQPRSSRTNGAAAEKISFTGVEAQGVERETGGIVLLAKPPLQVVETAAADPLVRIDPRELPEWAGISPGGSVGGEAVVLAYRYLRPGYTLGVEARRFAEATVLQALVESARLTTIVADDGQIMTQMILSVRHNGLQHLEVELPKGAKVWSAFVAGQPVRPATRAGKLLLPLEPSSRDDAPASIEVTFVGSQPFPRAKGQVRLLSPKFDVPLKNARWDLYLPPDYDYTKFEGSMTHAAETAPVVQVYSSREYFKQEEANKLAKKTEVMNFLSNARRRLSEGKLKGASDDFSQALRLNKDGADEQATRELDALKEELGRSQSSNLIEAQREYSAANAKSYVGKAAAADLAAAQDGRQVAQQVQYDADTAQQQWSALQRAQEVTVAKVQPLRVNLPTRGERHSFSQVLQTEVNQAMTITFAAANHKAANWFKTALTMAGGFLLWWIFVSVVVSRQPRPTQTASVSA